MAIITNQRPQHGPGFAAKKNEHDDLSRWTLPFVQRRATLKGCRGAREVSLAPGYIADAVYLAAFQNEWCKKYGHLAPVLVPNFDRPGEYLPSRDGELGANYTDLVLVFEAKRTRSDYLAKFSQRNFKERNVPVGNLHWIVAPKGVIDPQEVPGFWGLLISQGSGLQETKRPDLMPISDANRYRIGYELLWKKSYHRDFYAPPKEIK